MKILVNQDGRQLGPFTPEEARAAVAAGTLRPNDLAWAEGTPSWVALGTLLAGASPPQMNPGQSVAGGQTSSMAIASLVTGILAVVGCTCVTGLPAVICGHMAQREIRKSGNVLRGGGMAVAGLIMGYLGLAFAILAALMLFVPALALPVVGKARQGAMLASSINQARQIYTGCKSYASDHGGKFPETLEDLVPEYVQDSSTLRDPRFPTEPIGFNYYGSGLSETADPATVLFSSKAPGKRVVARLDGSVRAEAEGVLPTPLPVER